MPRYNAKREFQLGEFYLSHRRGNPAWCRTWFDTETLPADVFARFYERRACNLRSALQAQIALNHWLDYYGDKTVKEAAVPREQEKFHHWLRTERTMAHNTVHRTVAVGKAAINWAWKRGEIESLPYIFPISLKPGPPIGRPMEIEEIAKLFDVATSVARGPGQCRPGRTG